MAGSCDIAWIRKKVQTRVSWVVALFLLGTADVLVNWLNWVDLSSKELERGLIVGPPPRNLWILLMVFTVVGTILYIPEAVNTLSVFFCNGQTRVPIVYEQLVVLCLEHIPLCAINFFLSRCRGEYMTNFQTLSGTIFLVYIFIRLLWHAHLEGKLLLQEGVNQNRGLFLLCCALYALAVSFPLRGWMTQMEVLPVHKQVEGVSVYLMKAPSLENTEVHDLDIANFLESQGIDQQTNPVLINDVATVTKSRSDLGVSVSYICNTNATFKPVECAGEGILYFRFIYEHYLEAGPYGEIIYNFAFIPTSAAGRRSNVTCITSRRNLQDHWRLFYFEVQSRGGSNHVVSTPWRAICTTPQPWYNPDIDICGSLDPSSHSPTL